MIDERGLAKRTKESPLPPSFTCPSTILSESPNHPIVPSLERSHEQLPFGPTKREMKQERKWGTRDEHCSAQSLRLSYFDSWKLESKILQTSVEKLSSLHPSICNLVPVHKRVVKLCTDHFIKISPFICCQRATKELLCVCGDSRIMLGWIIERQILAKILSVTPRITIAIPKPSSWEKP